MSLLVLGLQWGDEGKGKAIDYLAKGFDVVVRYQGGHNAGHTIYYQGKKVILHLLPSGIFTPNTLSVIGNGVIVNPLQLVKEIKNAQSIGLAMDNLVLSSNAPLILPDHQNLDIIFEKSRYLKIGTTKRGIGPAYEDVTGRRAVFVRDLLDRESFYRKVKPINEYYNQIIRAYQGEEMQIESYLDQYIEAGEFLKPYVKDTIYLLNQFYEEDKQILFEGAQGVLLDINFGTYPYVTSSNPTIGGVFSGTGLSHKALGKVTGVVKAYTTRVGGGPFPSEVFAEEADVLREAGSEYGSTTGRPRRVGWLDLVALKYSIMLNGVDEVFLTKLDVLDDFEEIKVVTAYEYKGQKTNHFNPHIDYLDAVKPVCKSFPGWGESTGETRDYGQLPVKVKNYLEYIEDFIKIPIAYISVGSTREQTICKG